MMNVMTETNTLIAFATRGGTTEEYAEAIRSVLINEFNMQADLVNLKKMRNLDLTQYHNIIVGAGIKMFRMHKEGAQFLEKTNFLEKNVGVFLSSLMPRDEAIKKYVDAILQKNTTLKPIGVEVFGGRMRIFGRTSQDQTDIEKAKVWTRKIAGHLRN
jgi:menaquinone-dependent protoporphyrinogen IX oxidase